MPRWFFVLAALAIATSILLPFPFVKYTVFTLFGLIFVLSYREYPERTLMMFILGMPVLDLVPPTLIPIPTLNVETIIIIALMIAAGVSRSSQPPLTGRNSLMLPIVFYVGLLTLSAALSYASGDARIFVYGRWNRLGPWDIFSNLKNQIFFVFLAPIAFRLLWTPRRLRDAFDLIALSTLLVSVHALWLTRNTILAGFMLERNRASGLIGAQPNLFGGYLAMVITLLLSLIVGKTLSFKRRVFYSVTLVFTAAALLYTLSRGSWLALVSALGLLALLRGVRFIIPLLVIALSVPLWIPDKVVERVNETSQGKMSTEDQALEDSAQVRLDQWTALPDMLMAAPFLGHGYMRFSIVWEQYGPSRLPKSAHSSIIELTIEEGLFGLCAYICLVATLAWAGARAWLRSRDPFVKTLGQAFIGTIVCLVILDCSGTRFRNREVMAYLWIIGGSLLRLSLPGAVGTAEAGDEAKEESAAPVPSMSAT